MTRALGPALAWAILTGCAASAPPPAPASAPAANEQCVRRCVAANQMRAVSAQVVYADCEAECRGEPASAPQ